MQRTIQIGDDVVDMLDPDREAHGLRGVLSALAPVF